MSKEIAIDKHQVIEKLVKFFRERNCVPELADPETLVMRVEVTPDDMSKDKIRDALNSDLSKLFGGSHKIMLGSDTSTESFAFTVTCRMADASFLGDMSDYPEIASLLIEKFHSATPPTTVEAAFISLATNGKLLSTGKPQALDKGIFDSITKVTSLLSGKKITPYLDYLCNPRVKQSEPVVPAKNPAADDHPPIEVPWGKQKIIDVEMEPTARFRDSEKAISAAVAAMHSVLKKANPMKKDIRIKHVTMVMDEKLSDLKIHLESDRDELKRNIEKYPDFAPAVPVLEWMEQVILAIGRVREAVKAADPAEQAINAWQAKNPKKEPGQAGEASVPSL